MKPRRFPWGSTGGAVALAACLLVESALVFAAEPRVVCEDSAVRVTGQPDDSWIAPIAQACAALHSMTDRDQTASVRIAPQDRDLIVEVTLKDGRTAVRVIRDPAALTATLEALVALPPERSPSSATSTVPTPPVAIPAVAVDTKPTVPGPQLAPRESITPATGVGVEIGGILSARVAGSQGYFSPATGAFAQLRARSWRFGMTARWDFYQVAADVDAPGFEMETVAVGLSLARRWSGSVADLDVGMSPRFVTETQSFVIEGHEDTGSRADVRLGAFARTMFGGPPWRLLLELDAELSPTRLRRSMQIDPVLPPLPSWSAGVGAGFVWEEP